MSSTTKSIVSIAVIAFLFRLMMFLIVFGHPERVIRRDSGSYVRPAINILEGNCFSNSEQPPFTHSAIRTPIYPLLIAVLYATFDRNVLIIAIVQVLIDTLAAVLIYFLGLRLMSEQAARIGGLGYALSLGPAVHTGFILTETLFTLILLCAILTLSFYRDRIRRHWLLGGGVLIGMAILIRPIALFFPLIVLIFVWMAHQNGWRRFISNGFVFLITVIVVVAPWAIRNYWAIGSLTVSTISSQNLLFYNAVSLSADLQGISQAQARATLQEQVNEELMDRGWVGNEALSAQLYTKWSRKIILSAPVRYVYIHLKNDVNSFLPNITDFLELLGFTQGGKGTLSVLNQQGILAAVNHYFEGNTWYLWTLIPFMVLLGLIYIGAVVGTVIKFLQKRWYSLALLFLPVAYLILLPGAPSSPRFRVPAMPYICLLAGTGITFIIQHCWGRWQMSLRKKAKANE